MGSQKLLTSQYGRASVSVLLLQDLAVVPLLALVPSFIGSTVIGALLGIMAIRLLQRADII